MIIGPISLLGKSIKFLRKNYAFSYTLFAYFWLAYILINLSGNESVIAKYANTLLGNEKILLSLCMMALAVASFFISIWGTACTFALNKTLAKQENKVAERTLRLGHIFPQAREVFVPLFITSLLYYIFGALWTILFIVPGIIYGIKAFFYGPIIVWEGKRYRDALKESMKLTQRHEWYILYCLICVALLIYIPVTLIEEVYLRELTSPNINFLWSTIIPSAFRGLAYLVFIQTEVFLYLALKEAQKQ